ncbi:cytosolic carboxypeptidase 3 [Manis javanica]|uniref:cytosolic carboxypeptidase 3 n=1 Tax=Manis javanica TaxID=9974 RepID=UPI003C6D86EE
MKYYQCLKELEEMEKHINLGKVHGESDTSLKEIALDPESSSQGSDSSESSDSQSYLLKLTSQMRTGKIQRDSIPSQNPHHWLMKVDTTVIT